MRILLTVLGVFGLFVGVRELSGSSPPFQTFGSAYLLAGAILLGFGLATFDIVAAIERTSQRRPDQPPPPKTPQE